MTFSLVFKQEAIRDLKEAYDWYELRQAGLGSRFLDYVNLHLEKIQSDPSRFPLNVNQRVSVMRTFPFKIVFKIEADAILILAVLQ
jgi:hypothetical protein